MSDDYSNSNEKEDKKRKKRNNGWDKKKEDQLKLWINVCKSYNTAHETQKTIIRLQIKRIFFLTLLLSTVATFIGGAGTYYKYFYLSPISAAINAIIAGLTIYKKTENHDKKLAVHIESAKGYRELSYRIQQQLHIDIDERINANEFIKDVTLKMMDFEDGPESLPIDIEKQQKELKHLTCELSCNLKKMLCSLLICSRRTQSEEFEDNNESEKNKTQKNTKKLDKDISHKTKEKEKDVFVPNISHSNSDASDANDTGSNDSPPDIKIIIPKMNNSRNSSPTAVRKMSPTIVFRMSPKPMMDNQSAHSSFNHDNNSDDDDDNNGNIDINDLSFILTEEQNAKFGLFLKKCSNMNVQINTNIDYNNDNKNKNNKNMKQSNTELINYQLGRLDSV